MTHKMKQIENMRGHGLFFWGSETMHL